MTLMTNRAKKKEVIRLTEVTGLVMHLSTKPATILLTYRVTCLQ